ncbi:hypothetical protein [Tahibacter amnicola]|uniref:Calx-beta domain-containing protein n=1 Tax=Tahibacter amnicola TaxID=2976241 RepID=A0ABY6BA66_9GAMM|nr:hypothetical protein [Tahibacter amnicola]MCU7375994.1 hypothetical protein [Paucibacter sp. O1-1]MDA3831006.1 hypothetical protein [Paucibacter sp. O1-1]UXI66949.1 hypothetical protein N4264_19655 [Tahibacter amnicola]
MIANVKIKALSAAVLGLASMYAGSAFAQCAASFVQPTGAWSGSQVIGGGAFSINAPGLGGTGCKVNFRYNAGAGALASAIARDDSPTAEGRYRSRFKINASAITGLSGLQKTQLFTANSNTAFPAAGGSLQVLRISLIPGGANGTVSVVAATNDPANGYVSLPFTAPLAAGENTIETEVVIGGAGTGKVNVWVNNATAGTPTGTINVNNSGWVGIDTALLGLADSTPPFRTTQAGRDIAFDEFDSRRSTFIGP